MKTWLAFTLFAIPNLLAAIYSPIQDCDEVYNYWEPTHLLNHGHGFQTWEYSPEYGIRSWLYIVFHATIIAVIKPVASLFGAKALEFYGLRIVLGLICAACETRLYHATSKLMGSRIAMLFMLVTGTSTGFFHASTAYLPSSFAMYAAMIGAAAFMDWQGPPSISNWISSFGVGAVLGWPFAGALVLPFAAAEFANSILDGYVVDMFFEAIAGIARCGLVLVSNKNAFKDLG
jgi:alpha-1,2-mannosyltransferase